MFSQPALNATLNGISAILVACGYAAIRSGKINLHKKFMLSAFFVSCAFLVSYDSQDDDADGSTLAGVLAGVVPVAAGINLEYYFSRVDPGGYGCASKLPHNISALLGVMDGHASDLRTGLPWQMVEIHEPVRLLVVVEVAMVRWLA